MRKWRRFQQEDSGATAVEYAVMLAMIVMACLTTIQLVGTTVGASFSNSSSQIEAHLTVGS